MEFPELYRIRQKYRVQALDNFELTLETRVYDSHILDKIEPGASVLLGVGSRGIANYPRVVKKLVEILQSRGAKVSLLPAMGSHGGGTPSGQVQVLKELGITSEIMGAPIIDTMDVALLGETDLGIPFYADKHITQCDAVIIVNRIKPHTEFFGNIESGLCKMMAVGLGRHAGAVEMHKYALRFGYEKTIRDLARTYMDRLPILGGIGLVDTLDGQATADIHVLVAEELEQKEMEILEIARQESLKLPLTNIDILVVDEMGKNISGTGMDTKVIGRIMNIYEPDPPMPRITRIFVRSLTPETEGNAIGIGLADFTTQRLVDSINLEATYINAITAVTPEKGRIPISLPNEKEAITAAFNTIGPKSAESVKLLWIKNTLSLEEMFASPASINDMVKGTYEILDGPFSITFDREANLEKLL